MEEITHNLPATPTVPVAKKRAPAKKTEISVQKEAAPAYISPEETRRRELAAKNKADFERLRKPVSGKFLFNECQGGRLQFPFRGVGKDIEKYDMYDGQVYTVPLEVAIHLNEQTVYPEFEYNLDNGKTVDVKRMYITKKIHRTNFIPLDFTYQAEYNPNPIHQVTFTNPMDNRFNLIK